MKISHAIISWSLKVILCFSLVFVSSNESNAQGGFYFGPKGGMVLGFQNWNNFQRDPLFAYCGDVFIESLDPNRKGSLFASIGYHVRGSAVRVINNNAGFRYSQGFRFNNLSLMVGAKKKFRKTGNWDSFYHIGIRGEYNLGTDFGERGANLQTAGFFPFEELTNKFTYGISGGAGVEYFMSEFVSPFVEFTISPDLSFQYKQGAIGNVTNPYTGQATTLPEREIRNLSIELTVGFKFLRKVIYVD